MERRTFLKDIALGTGVALSAGALAKEARAQEPAFPAETRENGMVYRTLGKTGEKVSLLGLGGAHIGYQSDEQESIGIIRAAIDAGVNFMDNSWGYSNGQSEIRMGKALKDGYRDKVFLMTKVDGRTRKAAQDQLDESLRRLDVDHIDLWQFHEIIRLDDADRIFSEDGAIHVALEAQKAGKIRYIGFTGHKDPYCHLRMLEVADKHGFAFDAVQLPLNPLDAHFRSFEKEVVPELVRRGIGVLGMKSLASGDILKIEGVEPAECLRYAMSLPTSVVISGMPSMENLEQNLETTRNFEPLSEERKVALLAKTQDPAATGKFERFKTTIAFDATVHYPDWMG